MIPATVAKLVLELPEAFTGVVVGLIEFVGDGVEEGLVVGDET